MKTRHHSAIIAALLFGAWACGSGGGGMTRPIETLLYISGPLGAQFEFNSDTMDPSCGSTGDTSTGIQAPNASHQFGDRVFLVPHLFVMENIQQPVRAVIRNTGTVAIRADLYLGQTPQLSNVQIAAGECRTLLSNAAPFVPELRGPNVQVEVCSPINADLEPDLNISCLDSTNDRHIAFFATIGDIVASNITNCILGTSTPPLLDACRSSSTFFLEQPQDQVSAVMSVNPGQNPGGSVPPAGLRLELYVCGADVNLCNDNGVSSSNRVDFEGGTDPVVTRDL